MQFFRPVLISTLLICFTQLCSAQVRWSDQAQRLDYQGLSSKLTPEDIQKVLGYLRVGLRLETLPEIVISDQPESYFDPKQRQVSLPYSAFYRTYDSLRVRFPQQKITRDSIFVATGHFFLLSRLIEALVSDLQLEISGWPEERVDGLVTLILIDSQSSDVSYLLDAAEEYLIVDRSRAAFQGNRFKSEFEEDEYRLRRILCLISGFEADDVLKDESLNADVRQTYRECKESYVAMQGFWGEVLVEHLDADSSLTLLLSGEG